MMILRPVSLDDTKQLTKLGYDSFVAAFGHIYKPEDLAVFMDEVYSEPVVAEEIGDDFCIHQVACEGDTMIGYAKLRYPSWYGERSTAKKPIALGQLYTLPDRTGEGIGAALMEWAIAEARQRGHDAMQLTVWSENYGGRRFYERYGFEKKEDFDFYVGEHRDLDYLYELRL